MVLVKVALRLPVCSREAFTEPKTTPRTDRALLARKTGKRLNPKELEKDSKTNLILR